MKIPIAYIELPTNDVKASKQFYGELFGWEFEDWGPDYAAFSKAGIDGGFNGGGDHRTHAPLVVLESRDIEDTLAKVVAAGGTITMPIFDYPGGKRFHFTDPAGQELAVMQVA